MISYKIYTNTNEISKSWNHLVAHDTLLQTPFLKALEASSPKNITSYYIAFFKADTLVGVALAQRVQMYADDIFRSLTNSIIKSIARRLITFLVRGNAIVIGNLMHTGQHGIYYQPEAITKEEFFNTLSEAITALRKKIKINFSKNVRLFVCKDYFLEDAFLQPINAFKRFNLVEAQVQPNMLFNIRENWKTKADYLQAFTKKYRDRYKRARKKGAVITKKELTLESIKNKKEELYQLYENVSDNAGINTFKLAKNHFYELKKELGISFHVVGYFLHNKLVGFYTLIDNTTQLETYFLGYDKTIQSQYQIYLNMLYDMAIYGIENQYQNVVFARTAMEIKSSIGAQAYPMVIYVKHTNNFLANRLIELVVKYMNPVRDWQPRHPFKEVNTSTTKNRYY